MNGSMPSQNARIALKQMKMEAAIDHGMSAEGVFDMIEYAHNNDTSLQKIKHLPIRKKSIKAKPSHLE